MALWPVSLPGKTRQYGKNLKPYFDLPCFREMRQIKSPAHKPFYPPPIDPGGFVHAIKKIGTRSKRYLVAGEKFAPHKDTNVQRSRANALHSQASCRTRSRNDSSHRDTAR